MSLSYDNRETCSFLLPSGCIPYTGYISPNLTGLPECKININDVVKSIQELLDKVISSLGDNTTLDKNCFNFNPTTVKQVELNQLFINELCELKSTLADYPPVVDPNTIELAVDLLCLIEEPCEPQETYTLTEIINKLVTAYCGLLTRVQNIENTLNI